MCIVLKYMMGRFFFAKTHDITSPVMSTYFKKYGYIGCATSQRKVHIYVQNITRKENYMGNENYSERLQDMACQKEKVASDNKDNRRNANVCAPLRAHDYIIAPCMIMPRKQALE